VVILRTLPPCGATRGVGAGEAISQLVK